MRWKPVAYTALGLTSLLLLGATGYGWTQLNRLTDGLATADVIEPSAQLPSTTPDVPVHEQNILLVGIDARTDAQGNPLPQNVLDLLHAGDASAGGDTTDTMIVVHIPEGGGAATAISIPRDSYVQIAGGYGKHKINSAYTYGKQAALDQLSRRGVTGPQRERQADQAGARTAIQTVEQFTGLTINHYAAVNLLGFYTLSQAVGGVPVCLKEPVHDSYSGADFPAGEQVLSGAQALAFVRQRHGLLNGDLDRIARQQAFLSSAAKVVLAAGTLANPVKLSSLVSAVQQSVLIDSGWDILTFAQQMRGLSSDGLTFETIPVQSLSLATPSDGDAVKVDPGEVRSFIETLLGTSTRVSSYSAPPSSDAAQAAQSSAPPTTERSVVPSANSTDLTGCVN
ncbi:LCP family protein [Amycolatopsis sp. GM8]|uniref:LCP family protein n=1 Tax=Amycolatopsis sp. GM8 TaxID=2896530 RepID=UPI001F466DA0|nr:LCP family protein [Amycolatopsis sp. GM8]